MSVALEARAADTAWIGQLLACVDAKDTAGFLAFLHEDASFRFANQPAAAGRAAIATAVDGFFGAVRALRHELTGAWSLPGHAACEGRVTYTRHDGSLVTLPFANVFDMRGDRIAGYRIYIDPTPLFGADTQRNL